MSNWKKSIFIEKAINNQCLNKYIVGPNILWKYVAEWFAFSMKPMDLVLGTSISWKRKMPTVYPSRLLFFMVTFKVQGKVVKYSGRQ